MEPLARSIVTQYRVSGSILATRVKDLSEANPFAASFEHAAATDGSNYPTLAELLGSVSTLNSELSAAVSDASAAQLDGPMPGSGPHDEKRVFDTLLFFAWHEAYHLGGIGAIRTDLGRKAISEFVEGQ